LGSVDKSNILYENYIDAAKRICNKTFIDEDVDFSIALTHMRNNNDICLANCTDINLDLILGGHDHDPYYFDKSKERLFLKSGTDFREMTILRIINNEELKTDHQFEIDHFTKH